MARPEQPHDRLTERIIGCVIRVHQELGPGFIESIYQNAMVIECHLRGLRTDVEKELSIFYEGRFVGKHRLDLVVEDLVIVELKTVETLGRAHYAQIRSYLKASGLTSGLLVNFSTERADIRRIEIA